MKDLIIFPFNSLVGLTTNSSSEIFIATGNHSTSEEVDQMLLEVFKDYKGNNPNYLYNTGITKSKILNTPKEVAEVLLPKIRWYLDYYGANLRNILFSVYGLSLPLMDEGSKDLIEHFLNINQFDTLKRPMIIIESRDDNSIDYDFIQKIEDSFLHCERIHLG